MSHIQTEMILLYICHYVYPQLLDGLDVVQRNTLTSLKQEFVAHSIIGTYRNLTAQDFTRFEMTVWRHLQPFCHVNCLLAQ